MQPRDTILEDPTVSFPTVRASKEVRDSFERYEPQMRSFGHFQSFNSAKGVGKGGRQKGNRTRMYAGPVSRWVSSYKH
jgi:hypothetical protein